MEFITLNISRQNVDTHQMSPSKKEAIGHILVLSWSKHKGHHVHVCISLSGAPLRNIPDVFLERAAFIKKKSVSGLLTHRGIRNNV